MARAAIQRLVAASVLAVVALLGVQTASAVPAPIVIDLPAGQACAGFDLRIEIRGGDQVFKEFTDNNGNVVRTLSAGRGSALLFTNLATGESFSIRPTGSVSRTVFNPDGSTTQLTTGHNVLILFPTDIPAGPSTTAYVGRVVYTVDANGVFRLLTVSGTRTDICAALAP